MQQSQTASVNPFTNTSVHKTYGACALLLSNQYQLHVTICSGVGIPVYGLSRTTNAQQWWTVSTFNLAQAVKYPSSGVVKIVQQRKKHINTYT